jgi:hypothetical protein
VRQDKLHRTCVIISGGICRSRSALQRIQGVKCQSTIFHAHVGPVRIPQKAHWDTLCQCCVLDPVGYVCRVVHCGVSGARNIGAQFFLLECDRYGNRKKRVETHHAKRVFFHLLGYAGHRMHPGASGMQNIKTLIFMVVQDRYGFQKNCTDTCYAEHIFFHPVGSVC